MFLNRFLLFCSLLLAATLINSPESFGQFTVYDNMAGGPSGTTGILRSDNDEPFITADDVTLSRTTNITEIIWSGTYFEFTAGAVPQTDAFTILFFADGGGQPDGGEPLAEFNVGNNVNRVDTGFTAAVSRDVYQYSAEVEFTLIADTTYWLSIANDTPSSSLDFFGGVSQGGNAFHSEDDGDSWVARPFRLDFQLVGVPEPSASVIVTACFLCLLLRRTRPAAHGG